MLLSGMSTTVVTPPAAAAAVAEAKPSHSVRPGSLMCTCESTRPGSRTQSSAMVSSAAGAALEVAPAAGASKPSIETIRPSLTRTAPARSPSAVIIRRARNSRSVMAPSNTAPPNPAP